MRKRREVRWIKKADVKLPSGEQFIVKPLTNINKWPDYINKLKSLLANGKEDINMSNSKRVEKNVPLNQIYYCEIIKWKRMI